jgi:uncharacterized protein (DUF2147 family)
MRLRRVALLVGMFFLADLSPVLASSASGEWLVADKSARILIRACDNRLSGAISWEREHGLDDQNPDPAKRSRPTLGIPILLGMRSTGPDSWAGQIYNAENGKTYKAKVKLISSHELRVEGCVLGFICAGETWTKVQEYNGECPSTMSATPSAISPAMSPSQ